MLERMNGANPISNSTAYKTQSGTSIKPVSDNNQEISHQNGNSASNVEQKSNNVDNEKVKEAIDKMNADLRFKRTGCEFTYHEECNRVSIKLYDTNTKEVIREIPSEDTIKMLEKLNEIAGLLIDERL